MLSYDQYHTLGGTLSEVEVTSLLPKVTDLLQSFVEEYVPSWKYKKTLDDYGCFDKAIVYQMDFIMSIGGDAVFNGTSDLDIKEVSTSNFKYSISTDIKKVNGIPISPLTNSLITKELRLQGYLSRCLND